MFTQAMNMHTKKLNMLNNYLLFLLLLSTISSGCDFIFKKDINSKIEPISQIETGIFIGQKNKDTLEYSTLANRLTDIKYCLFDSIKGEVISGDRIKKEPFEEIELAVYNDNRDLTDQDIRGIQDTLNILLSKSKFGCNVKLKNIRIQANELSKIKTQGAINTNNIITDLKDNNLFEEDFHYHIYLFDQSEFFNTANAITLKSEDHRIIMGDKDLLKTEMLFLHELGHAFGLTHNNENYSNCSMDAQNQCLYNVMHESNIGCSRIFTYRQSLIATHGGWIPPIHDDTGGILDICTCFTEPNSDKKLFEDFVNSFDKNIDDTPAVDNLAALENYYKEEISKDSLDPKIAERLKNNYGQEFDYYFTLNPKIDNRTLYINKRLKSHKKLRKNNLLRWLNHEREKTALPIANISDLIDGTEPIENYFKETFDLRSKDLIAQLEKHNAIIQQKPDPINCDVCKNDYNWISLEEITYALCWQYIGESLCIENPQPPKPVEIINGVDRILRQQSEQRQILINKLTEGIKDSELFELISNRMETTSDKEFKVKVQKALER